MLRLRFPRPAVQHPGSLPLELRWDGAPAAATLLSRRQFLRALAVVLAALAVPWTGARRAWARARGRFFTAHERATLEALVDRVIPPDHDPGAKTLGAAHYIEGLLTAFDQHPPRIFAGGPFSGRTPFANENTGAPTHRRPKNSFRHFIPLSRLEELRWRAEIFGSARAGLAGYLDAQLGGPLVGLRDLYRQSLAKVDRVAVAVAGAAFVRLSRDAQDRVFRMLDAGAFRPDPARGGMTFVDILIQHTLEGCFAPPEYGGNRGRRGWAMIGLEGDDQPFGYSHFAGEVGTYREDPAQPVSTADPDELGPGGTVVPKPLSAAGQSIEDTIVTLTNLLGPSCG